MRRIAVSILIAGLVACHREAAQEHAAAPLPPTPTEFAEGERLYDGTCAACHGPKATGTAQGPPFVHVFYVPSHHPDLAFQMAAKNGVVAHHWRFGNMPAQPKVSEADVTKIVGYVRWLQRQAGLIH